MSGDNDRRSWEKHKKLNKAQEQFAMEGISEHDESEHKDDAAGKMDQYDRTEALRAGLANISRDIRDLKQEL